MKLWISLIGLVLFSLGTVLMAATQESVEFAIGYGLAYVIIVPFIMYGLSCLGPGGCTIYAWCLAIISVIIGVQTILEALFQAKRIPKKIDSKSK